MVGANSASKALSSTTKTSLTGAVFTRTVLRFFIMLFGPADTLTSVAMPLASRIRTSIPHRLQDKIPRHHNPHPGRAPRVPNFKSRRGARPRKQRQPARACYARRDGFMLPSYETRAAPEG